MYNLLPGHKGNRGMENEKGRVEIKKFALHKDYLAE